MLAVKVNIGKEVKEASLEPGATVEDLLKSLGLYIDAYIVTMSSRPVPITRRLEEGDEFKLIKVASGG